MDEIEIKPSDVAIWMSMAEHFLDNETRPAIPYTAFLCVAASLSVQEAHAIWSYEVSPVVSANLLSVAGEWAGWDEEWLVARVAKRARRRRGRKRQGGPIAKLLARWRIDLNRAVWRSIERCMLVLADVPDAERETVMSDLSILADFYFGSAIPPTVDEARRQRLVGMRETLFSVLDPVTLSDERTATRERIESVLAAPTAQ